jgi:hypothetical protein
MNAVHSAAVSGDAVEAGIRVGFVGRLLLAWTMAGGIVFGGFLHALLALTDPGRSTVDVTAGIGLFGFGVVAGFAHGAMLAWFGRPRGTTAVEAAWRLLHGVFLALPGTVVAMFVAFSISSGPAGVRSGRVALWMGSAVAALLGLIICGWASVLGVRALRNALLRWPERKPGVALALLTFIGLAGVFVMRRPEIWWTDLRVTSAGAVLLAVGATIWIAVPLEILVLHQLRRRREGGAS